MSDDYNFERIMHQGGLSEDELKASQGKAILNHLEALFNVDPNSLAGSTYRRFRLGGYEPGDIKYTMGQDAPHVEHSHGNFLAHWYGGSDIYFSHKSDPYNYLDDSPATIDDWSEPQGEVEPYVKSDHQEALEDWVSDNGDDYKDLD